MPRLRCQAYTLPEVNGVAAIQCASKEDRPRFGVACHIRIRVFDYRIDGGWRHYPAFQLLIECGIAKKIRARNNPAAPEIVSGDAVVIAIQRQTFEILN